LRVQLRLILPLTALIEVGYFVLCMNRLIDYLQLGAFFLLIIFGVVGFILRLVQVGILC